MAACYACQRTVFDGVALYRQNALGEEGVWACGAHNTQPEGDVVAEIIEIITSEDDT